MVNDGCTGFPEFWRGIDLTACCDAHDAKWANDLSVVDWLVSNAELSKCFFDVGAWELALPAFVAVSTIGAVLYFVFRKKTK